MLFEKEHPLIFNGGLRIDFSFVFIESLNCLAADFGQGLHDGWPLLPVRINIKKLVRCQGGRLIGRDFSATAVHGLLLIGTDGLLLFQDGGLMPYLFLAVPLSNLYLLRKKLMLLLKVSVCQHVIMDRNILDGSVLLLLHI